MKLSRTTVIVDVVHIINFTRIISFQFTSVTPTTSIHYKFNRLKQPRGLRWLLCFGPTRRVCIIIKSHRLLAWNYRNCWSNKYIDTEKRKTYNWEFRLSSLSLTGKRIRLVLPCIHLLGALIFFCFTLTGFALAPPLCHSVCFSDFCSSPVHFLSQSTKQQSTTERFHFKPK